MMLRYPFSLRFTLFIIAGIAVLATLIRLQFIVHDIEKHERLKAEQWALHVKDVSTIQDDRDSTKVMQVQVWAKRIQNIAAIESERDALEVALKASEESYFNLILKTYDELFQNRLLDCGGNVSFDAILNNNTIPLLLYDPDEEQVVAARNLPDDQDIDALNEGGIEEIESYLDKEFRFVFTDAEGHTHDTLFQDVVYLGNSGKYQILYQSYSSSFKRFVAFINNRLNAFLEEIEANAEFPILVVDEDNNALIVHGFNPEDTADINALRLRLKAINKPIPIHLSNRDLLIYYDNSLTYNQLNSFLEDIERSADFPIIVVDAKGQALSALEYEISSLTGKRLQDEIKDLQKANAPISLDIGGASYKVYYDNSATYKQLRYFPVFFYLTIIAFGVVGYFVFNSSRNAEQNRVWIGMAKETAHQLGTPISALDAWISMMQDEEADHPGKYGMLPEITKDVNRLQLISDRFSKIGSKPDLSDESLEILLEKMMNYLRLRSSERVLFYGNYAKDLPLVKINVPLFEWVVENVMKNALDAMQGDGTITVHAYQKGSHVMVDIEDTGGGIPRSSYRKIFKPGYTTKTRGWGLGLSLAKRIIEDYHRGKIYVKSSSKKGTIMQIRLRA
ncbi:MAG: ATP-binding protein [Bacteroidota bacterium]|nr:ATP-binding protein [Bacteroidota bacterium]